MRSALPFKATAVLVDKGKGKGTQHSFRLVRARDFSETLGIECYLRVLLYFFILFNQNRVYAMTHGGPDVVF